MKLLRTLALSVTLFALACLPSTAQTDSCETLRQMKKQIYGFRPSRLKSEERKKKSADMDRFWDAAQQLGPRASPCLTQMLQEGRDDGFFVFDASSLLFNLDKSPSTLSAIADALRRTDLKEVNTAAYIGFLLRLSQRGVDIGPLASRYLVYPEARTFLPEHGGMVLDRVNGAVLLYGSMPAHLAEKYLSAAAFSNESYARSTAVYVLGLRMTDESFKALQTHADKLNDLAPRLQQELEQIRTYRPIQPAKKPRFTRQQVLARIQAVIRGDFKNVDEKNRPWIAGVEGFEESAIAAFTPQDLSMVQKARVSSIRGVSDESLYEYFAWTKILLGIVNRYDLFKDYRAH